MFKFVRELVVEFLSRILIVSNRAPVGSSAIDCVGLFFRFVCDAIHVDGY